MRRSGPSSRASIAPASPCGTRLSGEAGRAPADEGTNGNPRRQQRREMSIERHPPAQLSEYVDGALAPADRAAVDAHLDTCAACRARLGELRATASLIGSLPDLAPTRRLTPRVAPAPAWLAPLRTMTTLASGFSVFVFLATA